MTPIARRVTFIAVVAAATALTAPLVRDSLRPEELRRGEVAPGSAPSPSESSQAASTSTRPVRLRGGAERDLARAPGKLLILHFWATWCPPCVEELPGLLAFSRKVRTDPSVELLAVSVDDSWKIMEDWLKARKADDLPTALDAHRDTARRFGTEKFPETYLISPTGEILSHVKGPMDWSSPELLRRIEQFKERARAPQAPRA
ncbi:MAG: TlpA disulfide reductase family protein [Thermoanaerobaculia bacterium]